MNHEEFARRAATEYASAVLASALASVYNTVTLSLGILVSGLVMLRSAFGKVTAYLGVTTKILGIVLVAEPFLVGALGGTIILASVLTMIWV